MCSHWCARAGVCVRLCACGCVQSRMAVGRGAPWMYSMVIVAASGSVQFLQSHPHATSAPAAAFRLHNGRRRQNNCSPSLSPTQAGVGLARRHSWPRASVPQCNTHTLVAVWHATKQSTVLPRALPHVVPYCVPCTVWQGKCPCCPSLARPRARLRSRPSPCLLSRNHR